MPTFETTERFDRDYERLTQRQREAFERALERFIERADTGDFPGGLRVKPMQGAAGIWEMSWAHDGRATFQYGDEVRPGMRHVIWRRVGTHEVFDRP